MTCFARLIYGRKTISYYYHALRIIGFFGAYVLYALVPVVSQIIEAQAVMLLVDEFDQTIF